MRQVRIVNVFFKDICIINCKHMVFLVFSILQKISIWYPISKFEFPLEKCSKKFNLNNYMKFLSNITTNQDRLEVHLSYFFPRFEPTDFLLVAFFFDGFLDLAIHFFCFTLTFFFHQKVNFTLSQVS